MHHHVPFALVLCAALAAAPAAAHSPAAGRSSHSPLPARQAGLWEVTVRSDDLVLRRQGQGPQRPQTVQQCTSAEAEPVMLMAIVPGQENCRTPQVRRRAKDAGGGYDIQTACQVHDNRVQAQMQLGGDLRTTYRGAYSVTYSATPLNNTGRMLFEGRRLGACKPGQRPGDMVLPNGVTVNVVDDRKRAEAHGPEEHGHGGHGHRH